jgi:lambda repressor-like predicted transcriptional regulator
MFRTKKWMWISLFSGVAVVLAVAGVWLFAGTSTASAAERTAEDLKTLTQASTGPGLLGEGYLAHGPWGHGGPGGPIDYQQLLADALGITVEELQDAFEGARIKAIEQAVEQELITQEQADELLSREDSGRHGFDFRAFGRGPKGLSGGEIDERALLADALGITVDELEAARQEANQAALELAIAEGILTEEQANEMQERRELLSNVDLTGYLDREALLARALGLTVEELQAALDADKTPRDLIAESELDPATLREALAAAYDEALAQAVADGVLTQEQADALPEGPGMGSGGRGRFGGRGKFGEWPGPGEAPDFGEHPRFKGRGDYRRPCAPDTDAEEQDGVRFRRPGRMIQGDSTL